MLRVTLRDIQHRGRQFAIAVFGAGVVFGLALLLSGVSQGFQTEVRAHTDATLTGMNLREFRRWTETREH